MIGCIRGLVLSLLLAGVLQAADWPTSHGDAARSGYTAESLPSPLALQWKAEEPPPEPAWRTIERMPFDWCYDVVVAGSTVFYGTSSEGRLVARDAATGQIRWTFLTEGPIRFAPVVWQDRVLVASDDGYLYCLAAADGREHWRFRAAPKPDRLLGNDRLISRWPIRGGPAVAEGVVYIGAGIWPSEGAYLYAIDIATGKPLWCNDSSGGMVMDQPHGGARAKSGAAFQGNIVIAGDLLLAPTGRAVPAAFDRKTGQFRYFNLQVNRGVGGSEAAAVDGHFINGGTLFALADGRAETVLGKPIRFPDGKVVHDSVAAVLVAAHPKYIVVANQSEVLALDRAQPLTIPTAQGKGKPSKPALRPPLWKVSLPCGPIGSLVVAGETVIVGGTGKLIAIDSAGGRTIWSADVSGMVRSLAVSDGRLLASTDQGMIYCFSPSKIDAPVVHRRTVAPPPASEPEYAAAAEEISSHCGAVGYCLDLHAGKGLLALELARRTPLKIYAVEPDRAAAEAARRMFDRLGLYGTRVTVLQGDPSSLGLPDYFADLVVSGRSVTEGSQAAPEAATLKTLRPCGGAACFGKPGAMKVSRRGPLAGAGQWTHLYADPANTLCSQDSRLRGPLAMLWFRDTDLLMPSRHGRGPAPLVVDGRMFVEGLCKLRAVNIYNGRTLWELPLEKSLAAYHQDHLTGVAATGSNLCYGGGRLWLQIGDQCLGIDAEIGDERAVYPTPAQPDGKPGTWGFLAYRDGLLFGSLANREHRVKESWRAFLGKLDMSELASESLALFALDAGSGKLAWRFVPEHSIRHNTIAIGPGRVYCIDRPIAAGDSPSVLAEKSRHPAGRLLCLDSRTGTVLWQNREDVFGTLLAYSEKHQTLLMAYQPTAFRLDSEVGQRMAAFDARDGRRLWTIEAKYASRPILIDRAVYAEPGKWDLLTGKTLPFEFKRSYGCGILAGSNRLLVYRSATLGYFDLEDGAKTENYGGIRPGCWVNAIPAGGLVLMGDAASWCTCSYLNQATIALKPAE